MSSGRQFVYLLFFLIWTKTLAAQVNIALKNRLRYTDALMRQYRWAEGLCFYYQTINDFNLYDSIQCAHFFRLAWRYDEGGTYLSVPTKNDSASVYKMRYRLRVKPWILSTTDWNKLGYAPGAWQPLQDSLRRLEHIYQKRGRRAAIMSALLPGSGKWYLGMPWQAVSAFTVVSVLAGYAAGAFYIKGAESGLGWTFATVAVAFYGAQIRGTVMLARLQGRKQQQHLVYDWFEQHGW